MIIFVLGKSLQKLNIEPGYIPYRAPNASCLSPPTPSQFNTVKRRYHKKSP